MFDPKTCETPLEMIRVWREGCSRLPGGFSRHPERCPDCTRTLIDAIEVWLRMPWWKRVWSQSRGYVWLRKYAVWRAKQHRTE